MLNQKKVEIFPAKFHKSLAKQFLEIACRKCEGEGGWGCEVTFFWEMWEFFQQNDCHKAIFSRYHSVDSW